MNKCLIDGCKEKFRGNGARGLCKRHYNHMYQIVKKGYYTWDRLEKSGIVLPSKTEKNKREKTAVIQLRTMLSLTIDKMNESQLFKLANHLCTYHNQYELLDRVTYLAASIPIRRK